jgi:FlaG/FlaF family flagellin (archaellin)
MCCVDVAQPCSDFSVAWLAAQVLGTGCAADTKFFDLKKTSVEVAAPAGEDEVKATCCTPFADAKCSDWQLTLGSCPSGKAFEGTASAPPDGSNGKTLSTSKYQELCCVVVPQTCSGFSLGWAAAQLLGAGCAADTKFFDLKKTSVEVAAPAGDDEVKAACCTPFAEAACSDWSALKSCSTGSFVVTTNSAPADGSDGKTLTQAKFQELCCHTPMKCADYTGDEVSSSISQATVSLVVSFSAIIAMVAA